jgi:hypothetical protein
MNRDMCRKWIHKNSDSVVTCEMQDKGQTLKNGPTNIHVWIKHKLLRAMQDFAGPAGLGV